MYTARVFQVLPLISLSTPMWITLLFARFWTQLRAHSCLLHAALLPTLFTNNTPFSEDLSPRHLPYQCHHHRPPVYHDLLTRRLYNRRL
ncbi:hypothetical protein BDQ17DRAFT_1355307, partial [Cyathus striatus]